MDNAGKGLRRVLNQFAIEDIDFPNKNSARKSDTFKHLVFAVVRRLEAQILDLEWEFNKESGGSENLEVFPFLVFSTKKNNRGKRL